MITWKFLKEIGQYYQGITFEKALDIAADFLRKEREEREEIRNEIAEQTMIAMSSASGT